MRGSGLAEYRRRRCGQGLSVGLKANGTVVVAGHICHYECNVQDWQDIIAILAGGDTTLGLKADGKLIVAGGGYLLCK